MTLSEAYAEKGLAVTQIQLWQQRLKLADEVINQHLAAAAQPNVVKIAARDGEPS